MTLAAATRPLIPQGEAAQVVTYPISVDYVKSWTLARALAEALANAIDADPENFRAHYDDGAGELVIEDFASEGIGVESMVFGWSDKTGRGDVIGQFGEGLKIATIRAVSDPGVTHMVIESVGVTIVPAISTYGAGGTGLSIPVKSQKAPEVLAWNLYPSDRKAGTKVRVGVSAEVGREVLGRFRHVTVPGYEQPLAPGVILTDEPGRVYIGGVFVTEQPDLTFGYDLALSVAKRFQNRDRTVIDSYMLSHAIGQVLAEVRDADTLEVLVRAALDGKVTRAEQGFLPRGRMDAQRMRLWEQVGKQVLVEPEHCFYRADDFDAETGVNLLDEGFREIRPNGLDSCSFRSLMSALGVKAAAAARSRQSGRAVEWSKALSPEVQERIDHAVATLRSLFGTDAVGKVKVYDAILDRSEIALCEVQGFYSPRTGDIAVLRSVCNDPTTLWEVLFHEVGHRIAHRGGMGKARSREYADRTRGFERVLGDMGVVLMQHIVAGRSLAEITPPARTMPFADRLTTASSGRRWVFTSPTEYPTDESFLGDRVRAYVGLGFETWVDQHDGPVPAGKVYTTFAKENYVTSARSRQLGLGIVGSKIDYRTVKDVCDPLPGVNPAVVWWATVGSLAMWMGRSGRGRNRALADAPREQAHLACADLAADPLYADLAPLLLALADGTSEVRPEPTDTAWTAPLATMMDRAEGLCEADALSRVLDRVSLPGDADPQVAWEAFLATQP